MSTLVETLRDGRRSRVLLWITVALLGAACLLAWWSYHMQEEARRAMRQKRRLRELLMDISGNLHAYHDVVLAGQLGGIPDEPPRAIDYSSQIRKDLDGVRSLLVGKPELQGRLTHLAAVVNAKLDVLDDLAQGEQSLSPEQVLTRVFEGRGFLELTRSIDLLLMADFSGDDHLLSLDRSRLLLTASVVAAFVLGGALAITVSVQLRRQVRRLSRSQSSLQDRLEYLDELMHSMNEVIWVRRVSDRKLLYLSPSVEKLYGHPVEAFLECEDLWVQQTHPEHREKILETSDKLLRGDLSSSSTEYPIIHADGSQRRVVDSKYLITDDRGRPRYVGGILADVTEVRKTSESLARATQQLEAILRYSPFWIYVVGMDGRYQVANPAFCQAVGKSRDEVVGSRFDEILPVADVPHHARRLADLTRRPRREMYEDRFLIDGEERIVNSTVFPLLGPDGAVQAFGGISTDVTDSRRAEQAERLRQKQLVQLDKMVSLGVLVSGVAHEINNPNHFITSHIFPLMQIWQQAEPIFQRYYREHGDFSLAGMDYAELTERVPEMLLAIREGSRRIKTIVDELHDYAREGGDEASRPVDVNEVVASAIRLVSHSLRKFTRRFSVDYAEEVPRVTGHYQRLEQVVVNLVQNAYQSLPDPERAVRVRTVVRRAEKLVVIEVADEGVGMDKHTREHATDPFFTTRRDSGGSGLGLSVSAGIVREHGGTLEFDSPEHGGTIVRVVLPLEEPDS